MATDSPGTIRHFLKTQVFRSDYLIVDEQTPLRTHFPYEHKLERMHTLCSRNGYANPFQCEQVRRRLYRQEDNSERPASLLLVEAYLPDCIESIPLSSDQLQQLSMTTLERLANTLTSPSVSYLSCWLDWNDDRYLMHLPADIHSLLIAGDGALLAA